MAPLLNNKPTTQYNTKIFPVGGAITFLKLNVVQYKINSTIYCSLPSSTCHIGTTYDYFYANTSVMPHTSSLFALITFHKKMKNAERLGVYVYLSYRY